MRDADGHANSLYFGYSERYAKPSPKLHTNTTTDGDTYEHPQG